MFDRLQVMTIAELKAKFGAGERGSTRYTTSSRTPGRVNVGAAPKLRAVDLGVMELCVCGMRRESHDGTTKHCFTPGPARSPPGG